MAAHGRADPRNTGKSDYQDNRRVLKVSGIFGQKADQEILKIELERVKWSVILYMPIDFFKQRPLLLLAISNYYNYALPGHPNKANTPYAEFL